MRGVRRVCQFLALLVVSPLVLLAFGVAIVFVGLDDFLGWSD
ncbi:hypothetical protein BLEM_0593 [Bifidobacterium lemurum]|uniref:Uncharacterized protein n=1 Tax=Bifidobacterium lemurum TaxID=1603886 RepID=A0A261FV92_9BIFI|nr:hypothetical protein BLEM_0593 [Bifidobacterium lemurum]